MTKTLLNTDIPLLSTCKKKQAELHVYSIRANNTEYIAEVSWYTESILNQITGECILNF